MVETDPRLVGDPLWSALDGVVFNLEDHPRLVRFQYRYSHADGFNGETLTQLCKSENLGPIWEWNEKTSILEIRHPIRPDAVVWNMDCNHDPFDSLTPAKVERTIAYLKAWQEIRASMIPKPKQKGQKRSVATEKGTSKSALVLAALCTYHGYDGTSVKKTDPVGVNELSRLATDEKCSVSEATVSRWFRDKFDGGKGGYDVACVNGSLLLNLKLLAGDMTPRRLQELDETRRQEERQNSED